MKKVETRNKRRLRRKRIIRKNIIGTKEIPRLSIFKSNRYIYVQAIDDENGNTITSASSLIFDAKDRKLNKKTSEKVGEVIADKLKEKNIDKAVFDRNGFLYTGKIKALADGARKKGIKF